MTEKQVRAAAKEINEKVPLEPPLDPKSPLITLKDDIANVVKDGLLLGDENFSEATQAVIDELVPPVKEEIDEKEVEEKIEGDLQEEEVPPVDDELLNAVDEEAEKLADMIHEKNIASKKVNEVKKEKKPKEEKEEVKDATTPKTRAPRSTLTKKKVIEEMTATKAGATIQEMAQAMVDRGVDSDLEKNLVVTKLWLSKMGFDTKKASIEKNPYFKK